jgi:hypothetical protein
MIKHGNYETRQLTQPVRVRVSEGEAEFFSPFTGQMTDNETAGGQWFTFSKGTKLCLVARAEKTDTYMLVMDDGKQTPFGVVLRRAGFAAMLEASAPSATDPKPTLVLSQLPRTLP